MTATLLSLPTPCDRTERQRPIATRQVVENGRVRIEPAYLNPPPRKRQSDYPRPEAMREPGFLARLFGRV